jgi:hypothetical protein
MRLLMPRLLLQGFPGDARQRHYLMMWTLSSLVASTKVIAPRRLVQNQIIQRRSQATDAIFEFDEDVAAAQFFQSGRPLVKRKREGLAIALHHTVDGTINGESQPKIDDGAKLKRGCHSSYPNAV